MKLFTPEDSFLIEGKTIMKEVKLKWKWNFEESDLTLYAGRIPAIEGVMARMRLAGKSLAQIGDLLGCTEPAVAQRLRKLHKRIEIMNRHRRVILPRITVDLNPLLHSNQPDVQRPILSKLDIQILELFVRNLGLGEIAKRVKFRFTRTYLFDIFERIRFAKVNRGNSMSIKPSEFWDAFIEFWKYRNDLHIPKETHTFKIPKA